MTKKILVIDDQALMRKMIKSILKDYEIIEGCDGVDGEDLVIAHSDLALLICDQNMPKMTGIVMVEQLFKKNLIKFPVLFVSSEREPELLRRAEKIGASWFFKPFDREKLLNTVKELVK